MVQRSQGYSKWSPRALVIKLAGNAGTVRSAQVCSASESLMDHGWVADLVKISMGSRLFTVESVVNSQYLLGSVRHGPDYRAAQL